MKCKFNFKIIRHNGEVIDLSRWGIWVDIFNTYAPEVDRETEKLEGLDGVEVLNVEVNERKMSTVLQLSEDCPKEFDTLLDFIRDKFNPKYPITIIRDLQPSKQIKAYITGGYGADYQTAEDGDLPLEFTAPYPYFESINIIRRAYTKPSFTFKNEGNVSINMRKQSETVITFKGASNNLTIKNLTTGDTWRYNGSTTSSDEIKLIGVRSLKNGQSIFGQTNHKMIDFAVGNNKFEIIGTSGEFELNIATRFYFL